MKPLVPALILSSVMVVMAGSPVNVWPSAQNDAFRFEITPLCDQIVIASRNLHKRANRLLILGDKKEGVPAKTGLSVCVQLKASPRPYNLPARPIRVKELTGNQTFQALCGITSGLRVIRPQPETRKAIRL
jgi:hypothetical protein